MDVAALSNNIKCDTLAASARRTKPMRMKKERTIILIEGSFCTSELIVSSKI